LEAHTNCDQRQFFSSECVTAQK